MAYTGLYNANGRRRVVLVSGLTSTGMYNADGSYNGVASSGGTYIGATHPCGALNVTIATAIQTTAEAPDGSYYIYSDISGYVLGSIGSSGTVTTLPAWVINQSNPPPIAIDWMNNRAYNSTSATPTAASVVTCARSSTSDYVNNAAGVWSTVAANTPRISDLGLLVEESRTNSIRNNSMQGAVVGTSGTLPTNWAAASFSGLTRTLSLATINGVDTISFRYVGTAVGTVTSNINFDGATAIAALTGQTWSGSAFVSLVVNSGSTPVIKLRQSERDSGGVTVVNNDSPALSLTPTLTKNTWITTLAGGVTTAFNQPMIIADIVDATAYDFVLTIGWPQLELGASVTSPIRTTAAAVTRAADVVTLTTPPTFGAVYSIYGKGTPQAPNAYGTPQGLILIDDGTSNNRTGLRRSTVDPYEYVNSSGGVSNGGATGNWLQNVSGKFAVALAAGDQQLYGAGVAATNGTGANLPISPNRVDFGATGPGSQYFNGFLEASAIWASQRVPNAQLQSMTT